MLPFLILSVTVYMRTKILKITIVLFIIFNINYTYSQENASEGTRFLIAFPQNERSNSNDFTNNVKLAIYISSSTGATVSLKNHFNNRVVTKTIKKDEVLTLDNFELGTQSAIEDISDGIISNKVIEIISDNFISVFVINSKRNTSDGYLAYPITEWGQNYIHNSFYHHYKNATFFTPSESRSSGFTLLAQEDNTQINIFLKGRGNTSGSTATGNFRIGDTISINLNKNQSYTVKTRSTQDNTFDLSGSLITSNEPIGVLSFHERTFIPQQSPENGRDHLIEMMQPLSNWRNKFVSIDFNRKYGDFYRVLPIKDNTKLIITNYQKDGTLSYRDTVVIGTGGNFYEYNNTRINDYNRRGELEGIKNITIWEADSPILVSQYAYSQDWDKTSNNDNNDNYDPFMLNLINEEQFTKNINFLVPDYNDFKSNNLNIVIKVDTTKNIVEQLESVEFDGVPLYIKHPEIKSNQIGNTEYYWLQLIEVNKGVHRINSNIKLAAFLYGFGETDSYGMQTALGNLPLIDSLVHESKSFNCDSFDINYRIKSTFGADGSQGFYSKEYKFSDFKVITVDGISYDYQFSVDSLVVNFKGSLTNVPFESKYIITATSQTGKIFYDTVYYRFNETIPINSTTITKVKPGEDIYFKVSLSEKNDTLSFLNDYTLSFKFYREWFELLDFEVSNESVLDYLEKEIINDTIYFKLNFSLSRENITNGNSVNILLKSMLNKDSLFIPEFILFSQFGNNCYSGIKRDTLNVDICVHGLRTIEILWNDDLELSGRELFANKNTNISIFNYQGKAVISNYNMSKGQQIDLNGLLKSKGLYFIKNNNSIKSPPLKYFHF